MRDDVCKIGAPIHALVLSCIEDQKYVGDNMKLRASCYWHSIFAHACTVKGHAIPGKYVKWRSECDSVFGRCGSKTVYEECPCTCLMTCSRPLDDPEANKFCRQHCLPGKNAT